MACLLRTGVRSNEIFEAILFVARIEIPGLFVFELVGVVRTCPKCADSGFSIVRFAVHEGKKSKSILHIVTYFSVSFLMHFTENCKVY